MRGIRQLTKEDVIIKDIELDLDFSLSYTIHFSIDVDRFFRLNTRLNGKHLVAMGINDLYADTAAVFCFICNSEGDAEQSFEYDISKEEEVLLQAMVAELLFKSCGLLPKEYYRDRISNEDTYADRTLLDRLSNEIHRLDRKLKAVSNPPAQAERKEINIKPAGAGVEERKKPKADVHAQEVRGNSQKEECRKLRIIRLLIADLNDIHYKALECHHHGPCPFPCPLCTTEIAYINRKLEEKKRNGERIVLSGISVEGHA